ncbi:hypothetical protein [uncultured Sphingomonas sp.]|uniref:hypothetical protein n=1 Tax=uncultured Sphingomonas sp. TaxID=158754 RepID=UPI0035C9A5B8
MRAHARVHAIDEARSVALRAAFREEIGDVVRSASPFLISLLAIEELSLDDAAMFLEAQAGWPRRPRLAGRGSPRLKSHTLVLRHYFAGLLASGSSLPPLHCYRIDCADRGWMRIEVADHSLEVSGTIGSVRFQTRFGELRLELIDEMPLTLFIACEGRPVEDVVDHVALRGRGWRIDEVVDANLPFIGQVLVVVTGSVAYRLPWAR